MNIDQVKLIPRMTPEQIEEREFWLEYRRALLNQLDIIERRKLKMKVRTSELRQAYKDGKLLV